MATPSTSHQYLLAENREWSQAPDGLRYVKFTTEAGNGSRPLSVLSEYPPNHRVEPHTHGCDYIEVILAGELTVGKKHLVKGDVRIMKAGVGYGPLVSGPGGCQVLTLFDRADGSPTREIGSSSEAVSHSQ